MTEEEKKAISIVENIKFKKYKIYIAKEMKDEIRFYQTEEERKAIDIVLNLIEKLQKENEELRQNYDTATTEIEQLNNRDIKRLAEIGELRTENSYLKEQKEIDMYLIGDSISKEIVKRDYIPKDKIREYIKEKEEEKEGVKNISLEEYAITSKELKESEICLLKCILEEK